MNAALAAAAELGNDEVVAHGRDLAEGLVHVARDVAAGHHVGDLAVLDPDVNWLGKFGISEKATGKKLDGKVPKYEIEVLDVAGKKLYYWTGTEKKEVPGQKTITKKNKKFRKGELDLGDPAVGWDR